MIALIPSFPCTKQQFGSERQFYLLSSWKFWVIGICAASEASNFGNLFSKPSDGGKIKRKP